MKCTTVGVIVTNFLLTKNSDVFTRSKTLKILQVEQKFELTHFFHTISMNEIFKMVLFITPVTYTRLLH